MVGWMLRWAGWVKVGVDELELGLKVSVGMNELECIH